MLQESDLRLFIDAYEGSADPKTLAVHPSKALQKPLGLFPSEFRHLIRSLEIGVVLGDVPKRAYLAAKTLLSEANGMRLAPASDTKAWASALAWALAQPVESDPIIDRIKSRGQVVGEACLSLRNKGYKVEVTGYGPKVAEASQQDIIGLLESLIRIIGGYETASQILRLLRDLNSYHDGMWLFGEVGLAVGDEKRPMVPVGWLFSLALKNLGFRGHARKPDVAWKSLIELATAFAATFNCQRYSQFDGIDLHASRINEAFAESICWREFFTLPQMPPKAFRQVLDALQSELPKGSELELGFNPALFFQETVKLLQWSSSDTLKVLDIEEVKTQFPILYSLGGLVQSVNANYKSPTATDDRTQDNVILLAYGPRQVLVMPSAFLAMAVCHFVFELIWDRLGKKAGELIGKVLERAVENSCKSKLPQKLISNFEYWVENDRFEVDVVTRDGDQVVFVETKAKALTRQSRSGNMISFLGDYANSFLSMLIQLVRHETSLKQGHISVISDIEKIDAVPPIKVAVSPLSYGPVSDKMLLSGILMSLVDVNLSLTTSNKDNQKILDTFNQRKAAILKALSPIAPKVEGGVDLFGYFLDVFWLDTGQLLYILDRANSVGEALLPFKHMSFSSRDLWTEIAFADRMGLTQGRWREAN